MSQVNLPPTPSPKKETLQRQNLERKAVKAARKGVRGAARVEMLQRGARPTDEQIAKHLRDGKKGAGKKQGPPKAKGPFAGAAGGRRGVGRAGGGVGGVGGRRRGPSSKAVGASQGPAGVGIAVQGPGKGLGGAFLGGTGQTTGPRGAAGSSAALKGPKGSHYKGSHVGRQRKNMPSDKH